MKYLIIGGAGYIGSHTVYELIEKNNSNKVIILDNLSTGDKRLIHPKAIFYKGNMLDHKIYDKIFSENSDIEIIINFAASIVVSESVSKPLEYYLNNTYSTMVLLSKMKEYNKKYLIFSSSAAVYGNKDNKPISELDFLNPINPYGYSKLMSEQIIKDFATANGIFYAILRYFNVAGAHQNNKIGLIPKDNHPVTHLIPAISSFIFNNSKELKIYGNDYPTKDGTCIRDYVHVQDLANAHFLASEYIYKNKKSIIINVGSQKGYSVLEIIQNFEKILNKKLKYIYSARREGDPAVLVASSNKIKQILNFETKYDLENIIKTELAWRDKLLKGL